MKEGKKRERDRWRDDGGKTEKKKNTHGTAKIRKWWRKQEENEDRIREIRTQTWMKKREWSMENAELSMEHEAWSMRHGAWGMEHGTWSMGHGAWGTEQKAWSMKHGTWRMENGEWSMKSWAPSNGRYKMDRTPIRQEFWRFRVLKDAPY